MRKNAYLEWVRQMSLVNIILFSQREEVILVFLRKHILKEFEQTLELLLLQTKYPKR